MQPYRSTKSQASRVGSRNQLFNSRTICFPNRTLLSSVQFCRENAANADWSILVYATKLQCATCTVAHRNSVAPLRATELCDKIAGVTSVLEYRY